jgi:hypothetical protein
LRPRPGRRLARALRRFPKTPGPLGRLMSRAAGLALLFTLSANWTRYQDVALDYARATGRGGRGQIGWRTQIGRRPKVPDTYRMG